MQDEAAHSRSNSILYRHCIHSLHQKAAEQRQKRVHLMGPRGCGKSIALASLVDWARSQGWLVSAPLTRARYRVQQMQTAEVWRQPGVGFCFAVAVKRFTGLSAVKHSHGRRTQCSCVSGQTDGFF